MLNLKRETSVGVSDLHAVSDRIKRLAISLDGHPISVSESSSDEAEPDPHLIPPMQDSTRPIISITSNPKDDFTDKYELLAEIGRGGFSTVYQCQNKASSLFYAVKIIDLRPLRLRERFNPARVRREVDIMRRLRHPNIIQFVDVFETPDQLMMVMEYCPGDELFDVILARRFFSEEDAKPIFSQIARALFYLHSLNIIHRDIKPENVLILHERDPTTGLPIAKLLDFGLSKNAGAGSAAKTFVGTPCYLAPEVEYTSKGLGGTYGLSADCWSLGAVLYVMLVARFPEFEADVTGKMVLRLPPALWDDVSSEAKDLIRSLMNANPQARYTAALALQHPWLSQYRATLDELTHTTLACYDLGHGLQVEEEALATEDDRYMYENMSQRAMVIRAQPTEVGLGGDQFTSRLAPLLRLQMRIAECFDEAHVCYGDLPEVATKVRKGAVLCRQQLTESTKMLKKVQQTAQEVLKMLPDLELAVEEGEPQLAAHFFDLVRVWVVELREAVNSTQQFNKASMDQIQTLVEDSTTGLLTQTRPAITDVGEAARVLLQHYLQQSAAAMASAKLRLEDGSVVGGSSAVPGNDGEDGRFGARSRDHDSVLRMDTDSAGSTDEDPAFQLVMKLFDASHISRWIATVPGAGGVTASGGVAAAGRLSPGGGGVSPGSQSIPVEALEDSSTQECTDDGWKQMSDGIFRRDSSLEQESMDLDVLREERTSHDTNAFAGAVGSKIGGGHAVIEGDRFRGSSSSEVKPASVTIAGTQAGPQSLSSSSSSSTAFNFTQQALMTSSAAAAITSSSSSPSSPMAATRLKEALEKLRQVDKILDELSVFWANTEVVLDVLTKKGQHVEQFIGFATKPRLMSRFRDRLEEYKRFWEGVQMMCHNYVSGTQQSPSHAQNVEEGSGGRKFYTLLSHGESSWDSDNHYEASGGARNVIGGGGNVEGIAATAYRHSHSPSTSSTSSLGGVSTGARFSAKSSMTSTDGSISVRELSSPGTSP